MRVVATKRDPNARYEADVVAGCDLSLLDELPATARRIRPCLSSRSPIHPKPTTCSMPPSIAQMKPTAYLYNIGRGKNHRRKRLDRRACVMAARSQEQAWTCFETEPLPADSPLWKTGERHPHSRTPPAERPYYFPALRRPLRGQSAPLSQLTSPSRTSTIPNAATKRKPSKAPSLGRRGLGETCRTALTPTGRS